MKMQRRLVFDRIKKVGKRNIVHQCKEQVRAVSLSRRAAPRPAAAGAGGPALRQRRGAQPAGGAGGIAGGLAGGRFGQLALHLLHASKGSQHRVNARIEAGARRRLRGGRRCAALLRRAGRPIRRRLRRSAVVARQCRRRGKGRRAGGRAGLPCHACRSSERRRSGTGLPRDGGCRGEWRRPGTGLPRRCSSERRGIRAAKWRRRCPRLKRGGAARACCSLGERRAAAAAGARAGATAGRRRLVGWCGATGQLHWARHVRAGQLAGI